MFIADPLHSRLNAIEMDTMMGDYRKAYRMAHVLFDDFKSDDRNHLINITPKETVRMISVCLYLQEKLGLYQSMCDLYESFICNDDIMTVCNPFSMYYIVEHAKHNPRLKSIHRYQSN